MMQDHDKHVWKGAVREVWTADIWEPRRTPYPTVTVGPYYECSGHLVVEGGHW